MKRITINALIAVFGAMALNAQVAGFKILNQPSSIVTTEKATINYNGSSESVFKTIEIIQYNYLEQAKKDKNIALIALQKDLYENSTGTDGKPLYDEATVNSKTAQINALGVEIKGLKVKQDSLYFIYTKDFLKYKNFNVLNFGPVRSGAFFAIFYGSQGKRFNALGNSGLNFGSNTASIYSELVSGNLGLFRVSFGSMISSNSTDSVAVSKKEQAFQRLVSYGGNTVLNFEYPIMYIHSNNNQYNLISRAVAKGTADLPEFGSSTEKLAGSGSFGIDVYGDASLNNNQLRFFFNFNANRIYGTSVFRDNLGLSKANFTFGQLSLGLVFLENFKISFIVSTFSSESALKNRNVIASGQVLR